MRAREVNRAIESRGGQFIRQRGSHRMYVATVDGLTARTTVPQHPGDIPPGLLRKIERDLEPVFGERWLR
jgi:predicted RNA binding protein YcfA (HicA-like mRNA interferase family)